MRSRKLVKLTAAFLALMLLAACSSAAEQPEETADPLANIGEVSHKTYSAADAVFSMNTHAGAGFNPYTSRDPDNLLLTQLVYDNVFEVDDDYNLSSRVITEWSTTDGITWYLTVDETIPMHDGSTLTAMDVSYSISLAKHAARYSGRFDNVYAASTAGGGMVAVSGYKADYLMLYLLTVPVVKYGSYGEAMPVGTGPYMFVEGADYLEAFTGYAGYDTLPLDKIYMKEYNKTEEIITAFEDSYLDLVRNDPSGKSDLGYGGNTEVRYVSTTNMHYVGFNMENDFVEYAAYRYALQYAFDREYAADTLMQRAATAAAMPIAPTSPLYNNSIASAVKFDLEKCASLLDNASVKDYDNDGRREYLQSGIPLELELKLIVYSESSGKGDIANRFASDMAELGVRIDVEELGWDDYVYALHEGEFDMYYAEVKISPNFDLTKFFGEDATLNYGKLDDDKYIELVEAFMSAGDETRQQACDAMCQYILDTVPFIPILFERQQIITHRNVITDMKVTSANAFVNIAEWTVRFQEVE